MRIFLLLLTASLFHAGPSKGQSAFLVGTSSVSLEPDSSIFSVALAGYGLPREGRFSITWDAVSETPPVAAITGAQNGFYAITSSGELLQGSLAQQTIRWKKTAQCDGVVAITAWQGKLFVIKDNHIWVAPAGPGKPVFKKVGAAQQVTALGVLNNKLYATNTANELLEANPAATALRWKKIGAAERIVSMCAYGNKLYALNSGDTLWCIKPFSNNQLWMEIGRNNGITSTVNAYHITVLGSHLYAVGADNKLYRARHNTYNNLTARAMAIKSGNKTVVLAGLDLTGFNLSFIDDIKKTITQKRGIPPAAILINASHTHFAPVTQAWTTWGDFYHIPDSNYLNQVAKKAIVRSIEEALDHMAPAYISLGRGSTDIGLNRRGNATRFKPYDSTLDVIKIEDTDKKIKGILFSTACHPVFRNAGEESYTLNANYPGVAKKILEEKTGVQHALFIQGCGGDINPKSEDHQQTGRELAADVLNVLNKPMELIKGQISYAIDQISIPVIPWTADSIARFRAVNAARPGEVYAEKNVRWADLMLDRYKKGQVATTLPVYVQTINIGNWKIVGLSREVVNEYAKAIRKIWPEKKVTVAGYCNDVPSYLPISWHIQEKHYEGFDSFFWYGQPGIPPVNVLELITEKIQSYNR